jgi:hypothetical protein
LKELEILGEIVTSTKEKRIEEMKAHFTHELMYFSTDFRSRGEHKTQVRDAQNLRKLNDYAKSVCASEIAKCFKPGTLSDK